MSGREERQRLHFWYLLTLSQVLLQGGDYASLSLIKLETRSATCTTHRPSDLIPHLDCSHGPGPGWISSWPVSSLLSRTFYCSPKPDLLFLISRLSVTPTFLPLHSPHPTGTPAHQRLHGPSLPLCLFSCFTPLHPMG